MSTVLRAVEAGGTKFRAAVMQPEFTIIDQTRLATTTPDETPAATAAFFGDHPGVVALDGASFGPSIADPTSRAHPLTGVVR